MFYLFQISTHWVIVSYISMMNSSSEEKDFSIDISGSESGDAIFSLHLSMYWKENSFIEKLHCMEQWTENLARKNLVSNVLDTIPNHRY